MLNKNNIKRYVCHILVIWKFLKNCMTSRKIKIPKFFQREREDFQNGRVRTSEKKSAGS